MAEGGKGLKEAVITIKIDGYDGKLKYDMRSNHPHAKKPATPLETIISAACYLAQLAEVYEGRGDDLQAEVVGAILAARTKKQEIANG